MLENLRIHLVAIGFRWDWIDQSINESKADKFYLFKKAKEENKKALIAEKKIREILKKKRVQTEIVEYNSRDILDLLRKIKGILEKEKNNFIYINVSAGPREVLISLTLSSMLFKRASKGLKLYSMEDGHFTELPSFEVKLPGKELVESMKFISSNSPCRKKDLLNHVFDKKILNINKDNIHNKYMKLNRSIVDKLKQWNFINIDGNGKGSVINLTEEGENLIKFL